MDDIITQFEPIRAKIAKKNLICLLSMLGCIAISITFSILFVLNNSLAFMIVSGVFIIGMIVCIIIMTHINKKWKKVFHEQIMPKFLENAYPGSKFYPSKGYSQDEFMKPRFFQRPDRYTCNHLLEATYGQTSFSMMDYQLERISVDKDGNVYYSTYAKGRYFDFSFPREFKGEVRVIEKSGIFDFTFTKLQKVELESVAFNKKFKTHATDQLTAFYVLTPQVQEKMLELESLFRGKVYYAFIGKHLYIAVNDSRSSFNLSLMKKLNIDRISGVMKDISIPKDFIEALKLNREKYQETKNSAV